MQARTEQPLAGDPQLEAVLPEWEWTQRQSILIARQPPDVYMALKSVELREMTLARVLGSLRGGKGVPEADQKRPFNDVMAEVGWVDLVDLPGRELVAGLVGKFWERDVGILKLKGPEDYLAFQRPGYAKLAYAYRLEPVHNGTRVTAETHVHATDEEAARHFRWYWPLIRLGAWLTAGSLLRAVRRRAERLAS